MVNFLQFLKVVNAANSPQSISDVLDLAGAGSSGNYVSVPSYPGFAVANDDSAILQILDFSTSSPTFQPGTVDFSMKYTLKDEFPAGSTIQLTAHMNGEKLYEGTLDACSYMVYADLNCPLAKTGSTSASLDKTLYIPDHVTGGRLSVVGKLATPSNEVLANFAAYFDIVNSNKKSDL